MRTRGCVSSECPARATRVDVESRETRRGGTRARAGPREKCVGRRDRTERICLGVRSTCKIHVVSTTPQVHVSPVRYGCRGARDPMTDEEVCLFVFFFFKFVFIYFSLLSVGQCYRAGGGVASRWARVVIISLQRIRAARPGLSHRSDTVHCTAAARRAINVQTVLQREDRARRVWFARWLRPYCTPRRFERPAPPERQRHGGQGWTDARRERRRQTTKITTPRRPSKFVRARACSWLTGRRVWVACC